MAEICSICRNEIDYKKSVLTSCNHYFCSSCFFKWLERKPDCPVCRNEFRTRTNYDIEVEREILEQLESEVRDYTNLVDQLREQAFNMEYKKNMFIKSCMEMDDTLKKKKEEFNKITDDIQKQITMRNKINRENEIAMQKGRFNKSKQKQKRRFGLNFFK